MQEGELCLKEEKIFNRNYILLMVINTLLFISFNIVNPVLPKHVTDLGMSVTAAGIISGCFSITSLIFRPLCGMAADRLNPKKMYVFAGIMMSVACAGYSFFDSFAGLFAVRILHGIFFAVATTVCLVMVTYFIPKGKMGQGIGFFGIGQIVAISFAPGLGLKVGGALGYGFSFLIASLMALIATVLSLLLSYEHSKTETERSEEVKIEVTEKNVSFSIKKIIAFDVIIFAVLAGLFSFSNSIEYTFMALYSEAKGIEDISIYFTVSAVFILISRRKRFVGDSVSCIFSGCRKYVCSWACQYPLGVFNRRSSQGFRSGLGATVAPVGKSSDGRQR